MNDHAIEQENLPTYTPDTTPTLKAHAAATTTAISLLEAAINKGASVEQLEKLLALQERWEANEARKQYFDAFTLFQSELMTVERTSKHKQYGSYASLGEIAETIREPLKAAGLSYRFDIADEAGAIMVRCIVSHRGGHSEATAMSAQADNSGSKNNIQARGSAVTYLQRYTLVGALGIAIADADDDGEQGGEKEQGKRPPAKQSFANKPVQLLTKGEEDKLREAIAEAGIDESVFCEKVKINTLSSLPQARLAGAIKYLINTTPKKDEASNESH